jgi:putative hydrolase of the HAD superfamily
MGPSIKAVIFDLGNTLIHFDGAWPEVMQAADQELLQHLRGQGFDLDAQTFTSRFRAQLNAYYAERDSEFIEHTTAYVLRNVLADSGFPDVDDEMLAPALESLYAVSQAHWQVEDDTVPTLEALYKNGYRLGVISNAADDRDVQRLVDKTGVRPYLDFVLSSAACGIRKPNPCIFQLGLDNWDLEPAQVAMVGDTLGADILGAQHAGLFGIWIKRRAESPGNRDHAETIRPDANIETLAELPALLAGKNKVEA